MAVFLQSVWNFIQYQLLGMKWLDDLIAGTLTAIGIDVDKQIGGSIQFFIYDTIKILVLLSFLIFIISYIQSFFPPERTRRILGRFSGITAKIFAALLGTVTPFCSCSSIPIFIGFTSAGLPVGVTFSFLISSPLVDLGSLVLLTSIFGFKVALAYVITGLILAVIGGSLIELMGMDKYVESFITGAKQKDINEPEMTIRDRLSYSYSQVVATVRKVIIYLLAGVAIGAAIHNWIPRDWIETAIGRNNPFSVIIATLVGVPMYADIFGTIPIAEALFGKGVGLGTILAFMMAVTALSAPSIIMLRRAVKPKLLVTFVSIVTIGIMMIGYLFNAIQTILV